MDFGMMPLSIQYDKHTTYATPTSRSCCGTRCARIAMEKHVRHAASMWLLMWYCILCMDLTACSRCSLLRAAALLCYCWWWTSRSIVEYVCMLLDYLQLELYLHLIRVLSRSDELLNPNYDWSVIGAKRQIPIPSMVYLKNSRPYVFEYRVF